MPSDDEDDNDDSGPSQSIHGDLTLFDDDEEGGDAGEDGVKRNKLSRGTHNRLHIDDDDDDEDEDDTTLSQMQPGQTVPQVSVETHWNVAQFLPRECEEIFERIIAHWITSCYKAKQEARASRGGVGFTPLQPM